MQLPDAIQHALRGPVYTHTHTHTHTSTHTHTHMHVVLHMCAFVCTTDAHTTCQEKCVRTAAVCVCVCVCVWRTRIWCIDTERLGGGAPAVSTELAPMSDIRPTRLHTHTHTHTRARTHTQTHMMAKHTDLYRLSCLLRCHLQNASAVHSGVVCVCVCVLCHTPSACPVVHPLCAHSQPRVRSSGLDRQHTLT